MEGELPLLQRLRETLGDSPDLSLLVLLGPMSDIDEQCRIYGAMLQPDDRDCRDRDVVRFRDHFEQRKIRHLVHTFTVVRHRPGVEGWTSSVPLEEMAAAPASRASIERLFAEGDRTASPGPAALFR